MRIAGLDVALHAVALFVENLKRPRFVAGHRKACGAVHFYDHIILCRVDDRNGAAVARLVLFLTGAECQGGEEGEKERVFHWLKLWLVLKIMKR